MINSPMKVSASSDASPKETAPFTTAKRRPGSIFDTTRLVKQHLDRRKTEAAAQEPHSTRATPAQAAPAALSPEDQDRRRADEQWEELRSYEPWSSMEAPYHESVQTALRKRKCALTIVSRDSLVDDSQAVISVVTGQVVLALMETGALDRERQLQRRLSTSNPKDHESTAKDFQKQETERRRIEGILSRRMVLNIAYFQAGETVDVVALRSHIQATLKKHPDCSLCLYTSANSALVRIDNAEYAIWIARPGSIAEHLRTGLSAALNRLPSQTGNSQRASDFLIRQGLSIAETVRFLDLEHCISCGSCEQSCSELYGRNRLHLARGANFYNLNVIGTCRTCADQRCVTACIYDAIAFDAAKGEVVIDEFACTGCSECSTACPYDAIEMREIDKSTPFGAKLDLRLLLENKDSATRQERARLVADKFRSRIASKCDHCHSHGGQQACVAACPGGTQTLFELSPAEALIKLSAQDPTWTPVRKKLLPSAAPRYVPVLWALSLVLLLIGCFEMILRNSQIIPGVNSLYALAHKGKAASSELFASPFPSFYALTVLFGGVGSGLMLVASSISLRRFYLRDPSPAQSNLARIVRLGIMRVLGNIKFHSWAGGVACLFVMLHSWGQFNQPEAILASASLALTIASGVIIRICGTTARAMVATASSRLQYWKGDLNELGLWGEELAHAESLCQQAADGYRLAVAGRWATGSALWILLRDAFFSAHYLQGMKTQLRRAGLASQQRSILRLFARGIRCHRHIILLPKIEPIGAAARLGHLPFTIILTLSTIVHVVVSLSRN